MWKVSRLTVVAGDAIMIGEAWDGKPEYVCSYQKQVGSLLNYPA